MFTLKFYDERNNAEGVDRHLVVCGQQYAIEANNDYISVRVGPDEFIVGDPRFPADPNKPTWVDCFIENSSGKTIERHSREDCSRQPQTN